MFQKLRFSAILSPYLTLLLLGFPAFAFNIAAGASLERNGGTSGQPLCPDNEAYDVKTKFCYPVNGIGPCGSRATFVSLEDNPAYGDCVCESYALGACNRPLSYWPDFRLCFELYTQGPCYEGEWLVAVRNVTSACVKNPCYGRVSLSPTNLQESKQVFGFIHADGKCYNTESQAFCGNGLVARFVSGRNTPECVNPNKQNCESPNTNLGYSLIP